MSRVLLEVRGLVKHFPVKTDLLGRPTRVVSAVDDVLIVPDASNDGVFADYVRIDHTNREVTLNRQRQVLGLMVEVSSEAGCIYVGESLAPVCVSPEDAGAAAAELENYTFHAPDVFMRYPHWVNYVRTLLESMFDPNTI